MKLIIEIPEKTNAHIRSDYGHGVKGLEYEDMLMLCDAVYHGEPYHNRPHGEWVFEKGDGKTRCDGWGCSSCGRVFHTKVPYFAEFLFCPNCGADMREEGESN